MYGLYEDLYKQNYTTWMKYIKEEMNKWSNILGLRIRRLNIFKMSFLSNVTYRLDAISVKIPASNFVDINKWIPEFIWRGRKPRIANTVLKEKNKSED